MYAIRSYYASILDVGGGHAQLAEPLVQAGYQVTVTGSDDCCRKRLDQQLRPGSFKYLTCDSLALPFENQSFDVVLAFSVITSYSIHYTKLYDLQSDWLKVLSLPLW